MQDMSFSQSPFEKSPFDVQGGGSSKKPKKFMRVLALLFIIAILGGGIFAAQQFVGSAKKAEPTPTPAPTLAPTDTPTPTPEEKGTPTPKPTNTPIPRPSVNPIDKTTGFNRSAITVDVQNGSGTAGVAQRASDTLKSFGYKVGTVGNADTFDYQGVTIFVKSSASKYLPLLKSDLSASYTVGTASATFSSTSTSDALIIVGK